MDRETTGAVGTATCPECGQTQARETSCDWCDAVRQCAWAPALTLPIWGETGFEADTIGAVGSAFRPTGVGEVVVPRFTADLVGREDPPTWHDHLVATEAVRA